MHLDKVAQVLLLRKQNRRKESFHMNLFDLEPGKAEGQEIKLVSCTKCNKNRKIFGG
jgi:hypothetical protein